MVCFCDVNAATVEKLTIDEKLDSIELFVGDGKNTFVNKEIFSSWFSIDTKLVYDIGYRSELENVEEKLACPMYHPICNMLSSIRSSSHVRKTENLTVHRGEIELFVESLSDKLNRLPVNAEFRMNSDHVAVFREHVVGYRIDIIRSVSIISQYGVNIQKGEYPQNIKLPTHILEPKFKTSDVNKLGIKELIGTGRSNFAGSPGTRIHNIKTAAEKFDGFILAPGEELSFVEILGPVNGVTGYAKELVIKDHKTQPEYGGGICQVSTTLFRSAIFTGLEITQRRNHSYSVKYYKPIGFDATIYIPNPDLKFKNNTTHHILFDSFIDGSELVFNIYGTKDGRKVDMYGPIVTEKNPDGSMKTYFTQKVYDVDGVLMIDDIFRSHYKSPKDYPIQRDVTN